MRSKMFIRSFFDKPKRVGHKIPRASFTVRKAKPVRPPLPWRYSLFFFFIAPIISITGAHSTAAIGQTIHVRFQSIVIKLHARYAVRASPQKIAFAADRLWFLFFCSFR